MWLLIVDDEEPTVRSVQCSLDWEREGVETILTAFSVRQAQAKIAQNNIDVVLCDIEMPGGSGLDLLRWARQSYPETQFILLTCHERFQYAQEAIELGCLSYLIKPVNTDALRRELRRAAGLLSQTNRIRPDVYAGFWLRLLNKRIFADKDALCAEAALCRPAFGALLPDRYETSFFLPILLTVKQWLEDLTESEKRMILFRIRNCMYETLSGNGYNGQTLETAPETCLCVLKIPAAEDALADLKNASEAGLTGKPDPELLAAHIKPLLQRIAESCRMYFSCDACLMMGIPVHAHRVLEIYAEMETGVHRHVYGAEVFLLADVQSARFSDAGMTPDNRPNTELWEHFVSNGQFDALEEVLTEHFDRIYASGDLGTPYLTQFRHLFISTMDTLLCRRNAACRMEAYSDVLACLETYALHWGNAMIHWCIKYGEAVHTMCTSPLQQMDIANHIRSYIDRHLGDPLNRETIAAVFFMHPDSLSRIFRKKTGITLTNYIASKRIETACQLLNKTAMSVSTVAQETGFHNLSYFSKLFKERMHISPADWRRGIRK